MADARSLVVRRLLSICNDLNRALDNASMTKSTMDSFIIRLEQLRRHVVQLAGVLTHTVADRCYQALGAAVECLMDMVCEDESARDGVCYTSPQTATGARERPKYVISYDQLDYFVSLGFDCVKISKMLSVSLRTVRRRMTEFGIKHGETYTDITDDQLDVGTTEVIRDFPNSGYRMVNGILVGKGIRVQLSRVREAIHRCDPEGVALRWLAGMHNRCAYSVYGSQALWHIDGNHKLIRWEMLYDVTKVVHH